MKIIKTEVKDKKVIVEVSADPKIWKQFQEKEMLNAAKNLKLDGFRKGKIPLAEAKKHIPAESVIINASRPMIDQIYGELNDSSEFDKITNEVYSTPSVEYKSVTTDELILLFIFFEFPKVKLGDYKKLKIEIIKPEVSDKEIDAEINSLLSKEKMFSTKDKSKSIELNDMVTFDFKGFIDNKEFPGGSAENYELEIGSKSFIPGFEEKMIGLKINEEKDLELSFPKDYQARDFAGKNVIFKVKIHTIKTSTTPKLDDAFVKTLKFDGVKNAIDLKNYIKTRIFDFKHQDANEKNIVAVNKAIVEICKIDSIPEIMLEDEKTKIKNQLNQRLSQMKMKLEDYAKMTNKTMKEFDDEIALQAHNNIIVYSAIDQIAEIEKIKVSTKELDTKYEELSKMYKMTPAEIKKSLNSELLTELLLNELTIQKIISYNV